VVEHWAWDPTSQQQHGCSIAAHSPHSMSKSSFENSFCAAFSNVLLTNYSTSTKKSIIQEHLVPSTFQIDDIPSFM
jgi:hypothetical protein